MTQRGAKKQAKSTQTGPYIITSFRLTREEHRKLMAVAASQQRSAVGQIRYWLQEAERAA